MLFSSLTFLFLFLPLSLTLYYCSPKNLRNNILLVLSILFFAWGGVTNTLLFIASLLVNYLFAFLINQKKRSKLWLTLGLIFNLGLLICFKYLNFLVENIYALNGLVSKHPESINHFDIALPLGISFYTFHQISMLIDLYRRTNAVHLNILDSALYVSFFPQLIAGPIIRYKDIIDQIRSRKETLTLFTSGIERFILGLFKKVILANSAALIADSIYACEIAELTVSATWLGAIAYTLQIFFDFSGYSDMAIGLGRMFGFRINENFNAPYIASSIKDFWRRWHISLSTWFRDYVYIPLGGNRISSKRTLLNLLIVFTLTGLWHGATWSFVFWGLFHGFFLLIERLGFDQILEKLPRILRWAYTLFIVIIGWIFFRIADFKDALLYLSKMFGSDQSGTLKPGYFTDNENLFLLLLGALISVRFFIPEHSKVWNKIESKLNQKVLIRQSILLILFFYTIIQLNSSSYNPFIYFKF